MRLGLGDQELALDLQLGEAKPLEDVDIVSAVALRRLLRTQGTVRALPVAVSLRSFALLRLEGNPVAARRMATAMVLQAVTWHAPDRVAGGAVRPRLGIGDVGLAQMGPAPGRSRRCHRRICPRFAVAENLSDLDELLADELAGRPWAGSAMPGTNPAPASDRSHLLVIIDGGSIGDGGRLADPHGLQGVTVIDLTGVTGHPADARSLRLRVTERRRAGRHRGPGRAGGADPHRHPGPDRTGRGRRDLPRDRRDPDARRRRCRPAADVLDRA